MNAKTLTYSGLVDFGEGEKQATNLDEKANHGLVLMFQPFADSYSQSIAVFASRGPVRGLDLAKLCINAIAYVKNAGAKVHGIISDGAQNNKAKWKELGVSATLENTKNWFQHPMDE